MIRNSKFRREAVTGKNILVCGADGKVAFEGKIMTARLGREGFRCHLIPKSDSQFVRQYGLRVVVVHESFFNSIIEPGCPGTREHFHGLTCLRPCPRFAPLVYLMNVLICDPISPKGIALLEQQAGFKVAVLEKHLSEVELLPLVRDVVALVVRSETNVTKKVIEAAPRLRVVGRAGVEIDNVDVEAATQRRIVV